MIALNPKLLYYLCIIIFHYSSGNTVVPISCSVKSHFCFKLPNGQSLLWYHDVSNIFLRLWRILAGNMPYSPKILYLTLSYVLSILYLIWFMLALALVLHWLGSQTTDLNHFSPSSFFLLFYIFNISVRLSLHSFFIHLFHWFIIFIDLWSSTLHTLDLLNSSNKRFCRIFCKPCYVVLFRSNTVLTSNQSSYPSISSYIYSVHVTFW